MKQLRKLFLLVAAGATAAAFTGCGQPYDTDNYGRGVYVEPSHNFFGIVKVAPHNFTPVDPTTFPLSSSEISARRDFSGDRISFFWDLITFTDY
jgi:hypothetical protein